jgi:hypothetical protein
VRDEHIDLIGCPRRHRFQQYFVPSRSAVPPGQRIEIGSEFPLTASVSSSSEPALPLETRAETVRVDHLLCIVGKLALVSRRVKKLLTSQMAGIVPVQQRLRLIVTAFGEFQDGLVCGTRPESGYC